jgi:hypothetical protein
MKLEWFKTDHDLTRVKHSRFLKNVVLNIFLVATIFEHLRKRHHASHSRPDARPDLRRMHVLVELVGIGDTRHIQRFSSADKSPERCTVNLSDNIIRYTIATSIPTRGNLASDQPRERECLWNKYASAFLELDKPFTGF